MTRDGQTRFAQSAWFWLRAYPMRWREARGDEMVDLLADLAGPGARRLGARAAASTVAAGWRERWRTHPPFGTWLAYRLGDRPLPARYRPWVRDDIRGAGFMLRAMGLPLLVLLPSIVMTRSWSKYVVLAPLWLGLAGLAGTRRRRLAARRHLPVRPGEPVDENSVVLGLTLRLRWAARPTWTMWAALAAVATVCGVAGLLVLGADRPVRAVAAAAAFGSVVALVGAVRLRRLVAHRADQPARWLVAPPSTVVRGAVVSAVGLVVGCVAALDGGPFVAAVTAVVGVAALPVCLVGVLAARRAPVDLAAVDVARIVASGRPPRVDAYAEGLVPASHGEAVAG